MEIVATMAAGPLGMGLNPSNVVVNVNPGSQAEAAGVKPGDVLVSVADVSVAGKPHDEVLNAIRTSARPVKLVFKREEAAAAAAAPHGAAQQKLLPVPSAAAAADAVKKAGSLMKGLLGAGVHAIQTLDKAIVSAVEIGETKAKQAATLARAGGARGGRLNVGELGSINLRLPREAPGAAFALGEEDAAFEATREMMKASEERLEAIRAGNDANLKLAETVDEEVRVAKERALTAQADISALGRALSSHLPALVNDAKALATVADDLNQNLVALESRLFALLLAKAEAQHTSFAAQQRTLVADYTAAKQTLLTQAEADPAVAKQLLAFEEEQAAAAAAAAAKEASGEEQSGAQGPAQGAAHAAAPESGIASSIAGFASRLNLTRQPSSGGGAGAGKGPAGPGVRGLPTDFPSTGLKVAAMAAAINQSLRQVEKGLNQGMGSMGSSLNTFVGGLGVAGGALMSSYGTGKKPAGVGSADGGSDAAAPSTPTTAAGSDGATQAAAAPADGAAAGSAERKPASSAGSSKGAAGASTDKPASKTGSSSAVHAHVPMPVQHTSSSRPAAPPAPFVADAAAAEPAVIITSDIPAYVSVKDVAKKLHKPAAGGAGGAGGAGAAAPAPAKGGKGAAAAGPAAGEASPARAEKKKAEAAAESAALAAEAAPAAKAEGEGEATTSSEAPGAPAAEAGAAAAPTAEAVSSTPAAATPKEETAAAAASAKPAAAGGAGASASAGGGAPKKVGGRVAALAANFADKNKAGGAGAKGKAAAAAKGKDAPAEEAGTPAPAAAADSAAAPDASPAPAADADSGSGSAASAEA